MMLEIRSLFVEDGTNVEYRKARKNTVGMSYNLEFQCGPLISKKNWVYAYLYMFMYFYIFMYICIFVCIGIHRFPS